MRPVCIEPQQCPHPSQDKRTELEMQHACRPRVPTVPLAIPCADFAGPLSASPSVPAPPHIPQSAAASHPHPIPCRGLVDSQGKLWVDYPYGADGQDLWSELEQYYSQYLRLYYKTDADVEKDTELQAFWSEFKVGSAVVQLGNWLLHAWS